MKNKFKNLFNNIMSSDYNKKCFIITFCIIIILCVYFQLFARYKYQVIKETDFWASVIKIDKLTGKSTMFVVKVKENTQTNKQDDTTGVSLLEGYKE